MQINWSPDNTMLKQFGVISLFGFGALGALARWSWHTPTLAVVLWACGVAICLISIAYTPGVKYVYVCLSVLTFPIGWVVSHLLLGILYFLLFTPVALIFRAIGRDALHRRFDAQATTYWHPRTSPADPERYFRQF